MTTRRRVQLFTSAVEVRCAWCGEPQPNHLGFDRWNPSDFRLVLTLKATRRDCVSCDRPILVTSDNHATFDRGK